MDIELIGSHVKGNIPTYAAQDTARDEPTIFAFFGQVSGQNICPKRVTDAH